MGFCTLLGSSFYSRHNNSAYDIWNSLEWNGEKLLIHATKTTNGTCEWPLVVPGDCPVFSHHTPNANRRRISKMFLRRRILNPKQVNLNKSNKIREYFTEYRKTRSHCFVRTCKKHLIGYLKGSGFSIWIAHAWSTRYYKQNCGQYARNITKAKWLMR